VVAAKLYPAGATTNSDAGVTDLRKTYPTLEAMQRAGMLLLVHGEVTSSDIDLFDREAVFIEQQLIPLRRDFPELKIVFEHITTKEAAQYVARPTATRRHHHRAPPALQPQRHLHRRHPSALLLPARAQARNAPRGAGAGRHQRQAKFFLGTDSAPHPRTSRNTPPAAPAATPPTPPWRCMPRRLTTQGALDKLEGFASFHGPDFYGLPRNTGTITLRRESWTPPDSFAFGEAELKPLRWSPACWA
jgi:dihydroorotase